ncbi:transcriptional regulator [Acinetobacter sp. ANC 4178]|nr:transcriptional regulator [Acinetobacter sp. ANC 4178]
MPRETTWLEFKENISEPERIGKYISALSNSATLANKSNGYLIWGIHDENHEIVGTSFKPHLAKKGNQDLESWLMQQCSPKIYFKFYEVSIPVTHEHEHEHEHEIIEKKVVILEIPQAQNQPTSFNGQQYIRISSNVKPLDQYPEHEKNLWLCFDKTPFEQQIAAHDLRASELFNLIDYAGFFDLISYPLPTNHDSILHQLESEGLIIKNESGNWDIKNLGAILFAKSLNKFSHLKRKAIRVIQYAGNNRIQTIKEQSGDKGYAIGFEGLISYVDNLLPQNEVIGKALRREVSMYPELSIRELIANAIIHQDFTISGMGTTIEIFKDRIEITNPGNPLVSIDRLLDSPPQSRNENIASLMRRIGICEERGSGIDKVVHETEFFQLPPPLFENFDNATRIVLFAHKEFKEMDTQEKIRACYLHACLKYVQRDYLTNASLRDRFKIEAQNSAIASRIIKDTLEIGLIKPFDPEQGRKHARYIPHWA